MPGACPLETDIAHESSLASLESPRSPLSVGHSASCESLAASTGAKATQHPATACSRRGEADTVDPRPTSTAAIICSGGNDDLHLSSCGILFDTCDGLVTQPQPCTSESDAYAARASSLPLLLQPRPPSAAAPLPEQRPSPGLLRLRQQQQQQQQQGPDAPRQRATAAGLAAVAAQVRELAGRQAEIEAAARAHWQAATGTVPPVACDSGGAWPAAALPAARVDTSGRFRFLLLRLRDTAGRQRFLVRGRNGAAEAALLREASAEVRAAREAVGPGPALCLRAIGCGTMAWSREDPRCLHITIEPAGEGCGGGSRGVGEAGAGSGDEVQGGGMGLEWGVVGGCRPASRAPNPIQLPPPSHPRHQAPPSWPG